MERYVRVLGVCKIHFFFPPNLNGYSYRNQADTFYLSRNEAKEEEEEQINKNEKKGVGSSLSISRLFACVCVLCPWISRTVHF